MTEGVVAEGKNGETRSNPARCSPNRDRQGDHGIRVLPDGVLLHIGADKGATAAVDGILAILGGGEDERPACRRGRGAGGRPPALNRLWLHPGPRSVERLQPRSGPCGGPGSAVAPAKAARLRPPTSRSRPPLAARLAAERGIDLGRVAGTGDGGHIVKRDIEGYVPAPLQRLGGGSPRTSR